MYILVVDDNSAICHSMKKSLSSKGYSVKTIVDAGNVLEVIKNENFDLIFLDIKLGDYNGISILKEIKGDKNLCQVPVILMTAYNETEVAIDAMKNGAEDYIVKPFDVNDIDHIIQKFSGDKQELTSTYLCVEYKDGFCSNKLVGKSDTFINILKNIGKIANSTIPVLLLGETGTGKDMVARAVHENSARKNKPFVAINCSAVPEDLLEAELFGYEKGAFTGASKQSIGKIEYANGGTIFLDEIGDMPLHLQAKLLRPLQEGSFYRLGGNELISSNVRFISATNQNIEKMIEQKTFRKDLFFRLSGYTICIPPLRERPEDIKSLIEYFVQKYSNQNIYIEPECIDRLEQYSFPGNVRELENIIRKALLESSDNTLTCNNFNIKHQFPDKKKISVEPEMEVVFNDNNEYVYHLQKITDKFQKSYVSKVFEYFNRNQVKTAKALKVSRNTLRKILNL